LQNFRKPSTARDAISGQSAFHQVGNAFLLKSLKRILNRLKDYAVSRHPRRFRNHGSQSSANSLENFCAA
jgi:hypothetical protein